MMTADTTPAAAQQTQDAPREGWLPWAEMWERVRPAMRPWWVIAGVAASGGAVDTIGVPAPLVAAVTVVAAAVTWWALRPGPDGQARLLGRWLTGLWPRVYAVACVTAAGAWVTAAAVVGPGW